MRLYTSQSDPLDFCAECFPGEDEAEAEYGSRGDGPDERGNCFAYDTEHPDYNDDFEHYRCYNCGDVLGDDYDHQAARREHGRDEGTYRNGYRVYRDGSTREDFGSDR